MLKEQRNVKDATQEEDGSFLGQNAVIQDRTSTLMAQEIVILVRIS
jgi:hypothetical protein